MLPLSETYKPSKNCRIIHISRCRKLSIQRCVPFGYPCSLPGRFVGYRPHFAKRPPRNFHRVVAHPFDFSIFPRLRLVAWPLFGRSSHQGSCCVERPCQSTFSPSSPRPKVSLWSYIPDVHLKQTSLRVLLDIDVYGEMGVDVAHLVFETLHNTDDQVVDDGLYRS